MKFKKFLMFLSLLVIPFGMFAGACFSSSSNDIYAAKADETKRIFLDTSSSGQKNSENWHDSGKHSFIYYELSGGGSSSWPGVEMTRCSYDNALFYADIPTNAYQIKFSCWYDSAHTNWFSETNYQSLSNGNYCRLGIYDSSATRHMVYNWIGGLVHYNTMRIWAQIETNSWFDYNKKVGVVGWTSDNTSFQADAQTYREPNHLGGYCADGVKGWVFFDIPVTTTYFNFYSAGSDQSVSWNSGNKPNNAYYYRSQYEFHKEYLGSIAYIWGNGDETGSIVFDDFVVPDHPTALQVGTFNRILEGFSAREEGINGYKSFPLLEKLYNGNIDPYQKVERMGFYEHYDDNYGDYSNRGTRVTALEKYQLMKAYYEKFCSKLDEDFDRHGTAISSSMSSSDLASYIYNNTPFYVENNNYVSIVQPLRYSGPSNLTNKMLKYTVGSYSDGYMGAVGTTRTGNFSWLDPGEIYRFEAYIDTSGLNDNNYLLLEYKMFKHDGDGSIGSYTAASIKITKNGSLEYTNYDMALQDVTYTSKLLRCTFLTPYISYSLKGTLFNGGYISFSVKTTSTSISGSYFLIDDVKFIRNVANYAKFEKDARYQGGYTQQYNYHIWNDHPDEGNIKSSLDSNGVEESITFYHSGKNVSYYPAYVMNKIGMSISDTVVFEFIFSEPPTCAEMYVQAPVKDKGTELYCSPTGVLNSSIKGDYNNTILDYYWDGHTLIIVFHPDSRMASEFSYWNQLQLTFAQYANRPFEANITSMHVYSYNNYSSLYSSSPVDEFSHFFDYETYTECKAQALTEETWNDVAEVYDSLNPLYTKSVWKDNNPISDLWGATTNANLKYDYVMNKYPYDDYAGKYGGGTSRVSSQKNDIFYILGNEKDNALVILMIIISSASLIILSTFITIKVYKKDKNV